MDLIDHLVLGLGTAAQPVNLLYCLTGTVIGTAIGVLPGLGPTATIAMLLPLTYSLDPTASLIMLAGIYYGAQYGGSTTAILINLPGEASSVVTTLDGYQMARQGRAGAALTAAAIGSFVAGTLATIFVAAAAPPLTEVALKFGSPEFFSLMVLALLASITLAHGSIMKALAMITLGLLLGLAGTDIYTGAERMTLGFIELADGLNFVAVAVGLFGVTEILRNLENERDRQASSQTITRLLPSGEDLRRMAAPILRGTALGSFLGVLPGGGAMLASFASYTVEKRVSDTPERFGHGAIEGVAGPESANNAAAQTSFIPMLTLGIPSNPVMAMMIGAFILNDIIPGPGVARDQPALFWGLIASMWLGNLMLVVLNLPLIGIWVRLLRIPYYVLFPAIAAFSAIGVYAINGNAFDIYAVALFGAAGYLFHRLGCEPAPFLLGFILGPMLEEHLRRAMIISRGDPMIFLERPISLSLLIAAAAVLSAVVIPSLRRRRETVFVRND
jgi:TctA family transporter